MMTLIIVFGIVCLLAIIPAPKIKAVSVLPDPGGEAITEKKNHTAYPGWVAPQSERSLNTFGTVKL